VVSLFAPAIEALEAIDDFINTFGGGHNADGHLRGLIGKLLRSSRS